MTIDYRAWPAISPDLNDVPMGALRLPAIIFQAMRRYGGYVIERPARPFYPEWAGQWLQGQLQPIPPKEGFRAPSAMMWAITKDDWPKPNADGTSDIRLPSPEVIAMLDDLIADDVEYDLRASEDRWLGR